MTKRAIIVVDLQNEYLPTGKLELVGIELAQTNAAPIIAAEKGCRRPGYPCSHEFPSADAMILTPGTAAVQIHPSVAPLEEEAVIVKNHPNSFPKTDLKQMLDVNEIDEVTIVRAMSHVCIDATTRAAFDLGHKTLAVHDACATRDIEFCGEVVPAAQTHVAFRSALAWAYATVVTTEQNLVRQEAVDKVWL